MNSSESFSFHDITPEMREHTELLRALEAPDGFRFMSNYMIEPVHESIPPASKIISSQEHRYGEENVFTSEVAYNDSGSKLESAIALYRREGAELIPLKTRIIKKLAALARH